KGFGKDRKAAARSMDQPQRRVLKFRDDKAIALPGAFSQLLDALRQLQRTAKLDRLKARLDHPLNDRHHTPAAHAVGPRALMPDAQGRVDETNVSHKLTYSVKWIAVKPI